MMKLLSICLIATLAISMTHDLDVSGLPAELEKVEAQGVDPENESKGLCCCCCGYCLYCGKSNGGNGTEVEIQPNDRSPAELFRNHTQEIGMDENESKGLCCCCCGYCMYCGKDGLPSLRSVSA